MASEFIVNNWQIHFVKRLFGKQRRDLQAEVRNLKKKLSSDDYSHHAQVKLYKAIMVAIKEKIPLDPYASHFVLTGPLRKYGRVKGMGLPDRYRLFFQAMQAGDEKHIFVLWLGYPRKASDQNDCYSAFRRMLGRGDIPLSLDELLLASEED